MKSPLWRKALRGAPFQRDLEEVKRLAIQYVKEETLQPLKDTGRFALYGSFGSLFVGFGVALLLLALLRFFQGQFEVFRGTLSWIPYFIVAIAALLVLALALWRVTSGAAKRRLKEEK